MSEGIKGHILEVSIKLFERYGYKKTTIEDIAREAGIGKGSVYLHFKSKEEILVTLIKCLYQMIIEEWIKIVYMDMPVEKKISAMLKSCIALIKKRKEEVSLETLPHPLVQLVLKVTEETRAERLTLLATVLDPLFTVGGNTDFSERNRLAKVLLNITHNIMSRLDMDKNFAWEEFLDDTLFFLLPRTFLK